MPLGSAQYVCIMYHKFDIKITQAFLILPASC